MYRVPTPDPMLTDDLEAEMEVRLEESDQLPTSDEMTDEELLDLFDDVEM